MKLDPVFLLAPKPKPKAMPSRRAFLGMGLAFVCGGAIGSACGYSVGRARAAEAAAGKQDEELPKSGNADLDEARRLAVKAPIEELMASGLEFLGAAHINYMDDAIVWRGVGRIADHVLETPSVPNRRRLAQLLSQLISEHRAGVAREYEDRLPKLKEVK